jgi:hypothetical protein
MEYENMRKCEDENMGICVKNSFLAKEWGIFMIKEYGTH